MAASDRLYEIACACRDEESRTDRLVLELSRKDGEIAAIKRGVYDLLDSIDDARRSGNAPSDHRVALKAAALKDLIS